MKVIFLFFLNAEVFCWKHVWNSCSSFRWLVPKKRDTIKRQSTMRAICPWTLPPPPFKSKRPKPLTCLSILHPSPPPPSCYYARPQHRQISAAQFQAASVRRTGAGHSKKNNRDLSAGTEVTPAFRYTHYKDQNPRGEKQTKEQNTYTTKKKKSEICNLDLYSFQT